eukprot:7378472-Prymnesium_polylepis.1
MTRMVGALHTDNAGELVSREFEELMAREHRAHDQPITRTPAERRSRAVHPVGVRAGALLPRGGQRADQILAARLRHGNRRAQPHEQLRGENHILRDAHGQQAARHEHHA